MAEIVHQRIFIEQDILTAKEYAVQSKLSLDDARRELNEIIFGLRADGKQLSTTFVVTGLDLDGTKRIVLANEDELESKIASLQILGKFIYSIQPSRLSDMSALTLKVLETNIEPKIINREDVVTATKTVIAPKPTPKIEKVVEPVAPTKPEARAAPSPKKAAQSKLSSAPKKAKIESKPTEPDANHLPEPLKKDSPLKKAAAQSFVDFSDDDFADMDIDLKPTPSEIIAESKIEEVEAVNAGVESIAAEPKEPATIVASGPRMVMVRKLRQYMEGGYMMSEHVNELVPEEESAGMEIVGAAPKPVTSSEKPKNDTGSVTTAHKTTNAAAGKKTKQTSISSFFKK